MGGAGDKVTAFVGQPLQWVPAQGPWLGSEENFPPIASYEEEMIIKHTPPDDRFAVYLSSASRRWLYFLLSLAARSFPN